MSQSVSRAYSLPMTDAELIETATRLVGAYEPSRDCSAGGVAAAIETVAGNVYTGICVDTHCSMGFCAEHAAVAEMLKARSRRFEPLSLWPILKEFCRPADAVASCCGR